MTTPPNNDDDSKASLATAPSASELDEAAAKFEGQKRWQDLIKTLQAKSEILDDKHDRIALQERIAHIYLERFSNQAEAIKANEHILDIDAENPRAIDYLKSMYEKRKDWDKLLRIRRREVSAAPAPQQLDQYLDLARFVTEKVKRPEVGTEMWEEVLARDPGHSETLTQLAGFYEKSKDYAKLADILRSQAAMTADVPARIQLMVKLGLIAGDRLNDNAVAVEAWRGVLALDPNDRRAQEALKKRFLTMHAWDELEQFYAESGKWDELIRLLEREAENPAANDATKMSLFAKVAQLWEVRKEQVDRAARYLEKMLEIDPANRDAALRLVPMYTVVNDTRRLAATLEVKRLGDAPGAELVETLRKLGELYEGPLAEGALAFERFRDALAQAPSEARSVVDLKRTAALTGRAREAESALQSALTNDPAGDAARHPAPVPDGPCPTSAVERRVAVLCLGTVDRRIVESAARLLGEAQRVFRFIVDPRDVTLPPADERGECLWDALFALVDAAREGSPHGWAIAVLDGRLENNWFSRFDRNRRIAFFSTYGWELLSHLPLKAFVAHELAANLLRLRVGDLQFHESTRACLQDLCGTKALISYKLRSGDVCPGCRDTLTAALVSEELTAVWAMLDAVRAAALRRGAASRVADEPTFLEWVDQEYPFPIARCVRTMQVELNPCQKWSRLIDAFEVTIKLITFMCLSALQSRVVSSETRAKLAPLARATSGSWSSLCFEMVKDLRAAAEPGPLSSRLQRLSPKVIEAAKKAADDIIKTRNDTRGHGFVEWDPAYESYLTRHGRGLHEVLRLYEPLRDLSLLVPADGLRRREGVSTFAGRMLIGSNPTFRTRSFETTEEVDTDCLLHDPDTGRFSSMHPWISLDSCNECGREMVFLFDKLDGEVPVFAEYGTSHRKKRPDLAAAVLRMIDTAAAQGRR